MPDIKKEALDKVKPSAEEKAAFERFVSKIAKSLQKNVKGAEVVLGGSGAKGTWLKGTFDIDLFVKFDYSRYSSRSIELSDILESSIKRSFSSYERLHGSRDYFAADIGGCHVEIIPILGIKEASQAKNITDVSPLHADWVNRFPALKDDIMLAKQFCRSCRVYGAESYIKGFSGYMCEVLAIHYKGFENLIKAASRWKKPTILDPAGHWKGSDILFSLNKSKATGPLILIDPVQKDRNAAAALSEANYDRLRKFASSYLRKPSLKFFEEKHISIDQAKKIAKNGALIFLKVKALKGKEDVVGSKLLKAYMMMSRMLSHYGFTVKASDWQFDKDEDAVMFFVTEKSLPNTALIEGPPKAMKDHAAAFKNKYNDTYEAKGKLYAKVTRRFTNPKEAMAEILKEPYIKEKFSEVDLL